MSTFVNIKRKITAKSGDLPFFPIPGIMKKNNDARGFTGCGLQNIGMIMRSSTAPGAKNWNAGAAIFWCDRTPR